MSANQNPSESDTFRNAVVADDCTQVRDLLSVTPSLVDVEFTDTRSTGYAIHFFQSVEMGELLIAAGADIECRNSRNESPLLVQCRFGSIEAMRLLLVAGANPNHGPCPHMPSETLAKRIELLQEFNWEIGAGQLLHDANHGLGRRIQIWLRYGADPNATDEQGQTVLHLLARRGTGKDAVRALIAAEADPLVEDHDGNTPLSLAQQAPSPSVANVLTELTAE